MTNLELNSYARTVEKEQNPSSGNLLPIPSLFSEWKWLVLGALLSFIYANLILSGWKAGFIPDLNYPYIYGDDATFMSWEVQRLIEGWLFDNPRSGYPFGSTFLDYPHSDNGSLLILKLFSLLSGSFYGALNLYLLTGFPVVFIASFLVLKAFKLRSIYAFTAALLFTFAPFHLWRLLGHIFYTWYFVVPIYFLYGWNIFFSESSFWPFNKGKKILLHLLTLVILSSFGVYYAFFGVITFITCGIAAAMMQKKFNALVVSLILSGMLAFGVGLNILPNVIYKYEKGPNPEVAQRFAKETEIYSLKIAPLFFPLWNHRIKPLRNTLESYSNNFEVNETTFSSSLGLIASLGFFYLLYCIFSATLGKQIDPRLGLLAILVLAFLLISTVGGLNVFFALYVSPLIRGWNRISIFISFATFAAFFLMLQENQTLKSLSEKSKLSFYAIPLFLLGIGLLDQTPSSLKSITKASKSAFIEDRAFFKTIENLLPAKAAIYQLPYMGFPEYGSLEKMHDYDLTRGFINSTTLRWSHAGTKGREGDLFYRHLAKEPLARQLDVIRRLGFSGIYIERRGFSDNADSLIKQLNKLLGYQPTLISNNRQSVFYQITPTAKVDLSALSPRQIMEQAGYIVTNSGPSYEAALSDKIDFARHGLPSYIINTQGLSGVEAWGRWSDANLASTVRINFAKPLPDHFKLILSLTAFRSSVGKELKISVGDKQYSIPLNSEKINSHISIDLNGKKASRIEFFPPAPKSTRSDPRKLSVGFVSMQIEGRG